MGPHARLFLAISASFLATPLIAQSGWLLPTQVQSKLEASAPTPSTGWGLANGLAFKADTSGARKIVPVERPEQTLFSLGSLVVTGFSGTLQRKGVWRKTQPEPDQTDIAFRFLDPNGVSAQLFGVDEIGFAMNGAEIQRNAYDKFLARDIGQVFGVAIDNAEMRNLYLSATSAYGLNIIGPDDNNDTVEERLYIGQPDAEWMPAQWGGQHGAGPGSIWKVDGETGQISLFATVTFEDTHNQGAALGNIAFDALHEQLFISDLQTGMIHRYDLDGTEQELFDHGVLNNIPYDPETVFGITSDEFDVEDPDTWGFAQESRRVWGLAAHGGRLYYGIADGPAVWSVGLDRKTGGFSEDAREEFVVPRDHARAEISDMVFAGDGALILGQRGPLMGTFDYENITREGRGANLRYVREKGEHARLVA